MIWEFELVLFVFLVFAAIVALEAGDADRVVQLTRQRIEESAQEAVQQLDLKGKP